MVKEGMESVYNIFHISMLGCQHPVKPGIAVRVTIDMLDTIES